MYVRVLLVAAVAFSTACASGGASRRPAPGPAAPGPGGGFPADATGRRSAAALGHRIVSAALDLRGVPYRNGGADPRGFDCSGLVAYVFGREGLAVPRQTTAQFTTGVAVPRSDIRAGDLLFFSTVAPGASHVAIAIDADEFVHAPSSRGVVRVERLTLPYWRSRFVGARRVR